LLPCGARRMRIRLGTIPGSTFVKAAGFSAGPGEHGTLRIKFDDATIDFGDVPYAIFRALVRSGKDASHFYLRRIYGAYPYTKI
jgi:hypothetical protein